MPRRTKKTMRNLRPMAKAVAQLANEAHSISRRLINISNALQSMEGELHARRKHAERTPERINIIEQAKKIENDLMV